MPIKMNFKFYAFPEKIRRKIFGCGHFHKHAAKETRPLIHGHSEV